MSLTFEYVSNLFGRWNTRLSFFAAYFYINEYKNFQFLSYYRRTEMKKFNWNVHTLKKTKFFREKGVDLISHKFVINIKVFIQETHMFFSNCLQHDLLQIIIVHLYSLKNLFLFLLLLTTSIFYICLNIGCLIYYIE